MEITVEDLISLISDKDYGYFTIKLIANDKEFNCPSSFAKNNFMKDWDDRIVEEWKIENDTMVIVCGENKDCD